MEITMISLIDEMNSLITIIVNIRLDYFYSAIDQVKMLYHRLRFTL